MKPFELGKRSKLLIWKVILQKFVLSNSNSLFPATIVPNHLKFLTITCLRSKFSAQHFCRNWIFFPFWLKPCTATEKPETLFLIPQSLQFILCCARKWILYETVGIISRRGFPSMTGCTSLMRRFLCLLWVLIAVSISTLAGAPTEVKRNNLEQKNVSRSCTKAECIRNSNHHNCSNDKDHTSNTFLNPYKLRDWMGQILWHSTTLLVGTLSPISILKQQLSHLEQTYFHFFSIAIDAQ